MYGLFATVFSGTGDMFVWMDALPDIQTCIDFILEALNDPPFDSISGFGCLPQDALEKLGIVFN